MEFYMNKYLEKNRKDIAIVGLFGLAAAGSFLFDWDIGMNTAKNFSASFLEMISFIPAVFILIGLIDVWVPMETVKKHTGTDAGNMAVVWMILLAMLQAGPLYGAFPVAYLMWKKGTSVRNIFIYIGAFTTMKLPMLGFEISFLGLKFSVLRTLLSLPVFISIAVIIDRLFAKKFIMHDGNELS